MSDFSKDQNLKLSPGVGFHLQPDGSWKAEKIPPEVLKESKFSGYLTINGYRSTVFDTHDKDQWAQKSTGTIGAKMDLSKMASRIAGCLSRRNGQS